MINQLQRSCSNWLSNNSSSGEIFNSSKYEYERALKNSGYQQAKLIFNKKEHRKQERNHSQNIIWFNPPFTRNVTINIVKWFLNLVDTNFPKSNKLHKIFFYICIYIQALHIFELKLQSPGTIFFVCLGINQQKLKKEKPNNTSYLTK